MSMEFYNEYNNTKITNYFDVTLVKNKIILYIQNFKLIIFYHIRNWV